VNKYLVTEKQSKQIYNESILSFTKDDNINFYKRKLHAYCVGTPRSGTHSIASLLKGYKVEHEPDQVFMIELMRKMKNGEICKGEVENILRERDNCNRLEMDSSHYNGFFIDELYALFPDAKYIFTIRDCISWLNSWFNHQLTSPRLNNSLIKDVGRSLYFDKGYSYTKYDSFLKDYKLFPLKSYLKFWYEHNTRIINALPSSNMLLLKTDNISNSLSEIADFLEIDQETIRLNSSHEGQTMLNFNLLGKIDTNYLENLVLEICEDLNRIHFSDKDIINKIKRLQAI